MAQHGHRTRRRYNALHRIWKSNRTQPQIDGIASAVQDAHAWDFGSYLPKGKGSSRHSDGCGNCWNGTGHFGTFSGEGISSSRLKSAALNSSRKSSKPAGRRYWRKKRESSPPRRSRTQRVLFGKERESHEGRKRAGNSRPLFFTGGGEVDNEPLTGAARCATHRHE